MIELSRKIIDLIENARMFVVKTTNTTMIFAYYSVGKMIVDELQSGSEKAEYGTQLLENVSSDLSQKIGRGFSVDNLENMRKFYLTYMNQIQISENASRNLENKLISENLSRKLPNQMEFNPVFKLTEFKGCKNKAGLNAFTLSPQKWIDATNAKVFDIMQGVRINIFVKKRT